MKKDDVEITGDDELFVEERDDGKAEWEKEDEPSKLSQRMLFEGLATLWRLAHPERNRLFVSSIGMVCMLVCDAIFFYLIKEVIDALYAGRWHLAKLELIGMAFVKIISILTRQLWAHRQFVKAIISLENHWPALAHAQLMRLSIAYHEKQGMSRNVAKVVKACDAAVQVMVMLYFDTLPGLFNWVINFVLLFIIDWRLAMLFIPSIFAALWLHARLNRQVSPLWKAWENGRERATSDLIQDVVNVPSVQAYVQERREITTQQATRAKMRRIDLRALAVERPSYVAINACLWCGYFMAITASVIFVARHTGTFGTVAFVLTTGATTVQQFWSIVESNRRMLREMERVKRLDHLLNEDQMLPCVALPIIPTSFDGRLRFEEASFRHEADAQDVVDGVSLVIEPGSFVAFVGPTGAGKTSVVRLAQRVFDVTAGRVLLDDHDVRTLDYDWYRRLFAWVTQENAVFDMSLGDNIAYGSPNASEKDILRAARDAHLGVMLDDKKRFPKGLETVLGERGVRLSGGERQRVAIARAYLHLLRGAKILVLDEATSALDSEAEKIIQEMIDRLRRERRITVIAIAHRLSTVREAECIYVMKDGKLREQGSHRELMREDGIYARLARPQLGASC